MCIRATLSVDFMTTASYRSNVTFDVRLADAARTNGIAVQAPT